MKSYNWGIIGPGKIAQKFATALPIAGNARLAAIASRDKTRADGFAALHPVDRIYDDYAALASDPAIDAVYIATPHGFHAEHAMLCLQQGKAVLCEKPMALSARQVTEMTQASNQHNAFLMEAMWTRFIPLMDKIMTLHADGVIGSLRYIRADFGFAAPFNPEGRLYNMRLGGGSLLDIGIYPLFLCLQLLGIPDTITASGHLAETGADIVCHALLGYNDGRSAVISSNLTCQTSLTAEIAGTAAQIRIPTPWYKNDRLSLLIPGQDEQLIQVEPMINGFEYQIREVQRCLALGLTQSPLLPHSFTLAMAETMDAIRRQLGVRYPTE